MIRSAAKNHRSVAVVVDPSDYAQVVDELSDLWGRRWFVLPNPIYGSWERAVRSFQDLDQEQRLALERESLDPRRPR